MKMFSIRQWTLVGIGIFAFVASLVYHMTSLFI